MRDTAESINGNLDWNKQQLRERRVEWSEGERKKAEKCFLFSFWQHDLFMILHDGVKSAGERPNWNFYLKTIFARLCVCVCAGSAYFVRARDMTYLPLFAFFSPLCFSVIFPFFPSFFLFYSRLSCSFCGEFHTISCQGEKSNEIKANKGEKNSLLIIAIVLVLKINIFHVFPPFCAHGCVVAVLWKMHCISFARNKYFF